MVLCGDGELVICSTANERLDASYYSQSQNELEANAALIVRAVNSHAALVAALESVNAYWDQYNESDNPDLGKEIRTALALAKGGTT